VIVRVHTTSEPDCVQLVTDVLNCVKLTDDPDVVTVTDVVIVADVVTVADLVTVADVVTVTWKVRNEVEVMATVVAAVSVTVFWARDPVRERVPNIKAAPIITPTTSMATVAV
jgi:hypothetical protein